MLCMFNLTDGGHMKRFTLMLMGFILGALAMWFYVTGSSKNTSQTEVPPASEPQALYWVAPMDDSYRRDGPGKSPMGMDLVPVYADNNASAKKGPGVIFVPPHTINNLSVTTAAVSYSQPQQTLTTLGHVQWNEHKLTHIHPRMAGWLNKVTVKSNGDPIQKGEPLYDIYAPDLINAQEELILAVKSANQRLVQASKRRLASFNFSDQAIDKVLSSGQAQQYVTYYAPKSGYIDDLVVRTGHYVEPGQQMMSIGNLQNIWVMADVLNRQINTLSQGTAVELTFEAFPGQVFTSKIDYIYPTVSHDTRTLQ